jgi:hypothetical protein
MGGDTITLTNLAIFIYATISKLGEKLETDLAYHIPTSDISSIFKSIYTLLIAANPIILILLGIIVFFGGKLAKFIGIIIILFGLLQLFLSYFVGS